MRQDLAIAEAQLRDYQARLGKPFTLEAYLCELTSLRDQLKSGLSASGYEADNEKGPSASELAERIKTLKTAHSVEATPQRIRQEQSTAEEPITARIRRRRSDAAHTTNQTSGHNTAPESVKTPVTGQDSFGKPMTFRERIVAERLQKPDGQSPT